MAIYFPTQFAGPSRSGLPAGAREFLIEAQNKLSWSDFAQDMIAKCLRFSKLSERQREVLESMLEKQEARQAAWNAKNAESCKGHYGDVGERYVENLTCVSARWMQGSYGPFAVCVYETPEGQQLTYMGGAPALDEEGQSATLSFKVKEHGEFRGKAQTKINYVNKPSR
jgi:hypothetical protein